VLLVQNLLISWCKVKMSGGSSSNKVEPSCAKFESSGDAAASPHLYVAPPLLTTHLKIL